MSSLVPTKRQALEETVKFWRELERTGKDKMDLIREDEENFSHFDKYHSWCALCEYTKTSITVLSSKCCLCPVDWDRGCSPDDFDPEDVSDMDEGGNDISDAEGRCQHYSSPFCRWERVPRHNKTDRKLWAGKVADLVEEALNKLEEE